MSAADRAPALLRFTGAVPRSPAVERFLDDAPPALGPLARAWFARLRACAPDVCELFHDGLATACVDDVPFAYVGIFRAHVTVGFFHGAALPDPTGLLRGTGRAMRHVHLRPGAPLDEAALAALVVAAHRDVVARRRSA